MTTSTPDAQVRPSTLAAFVVGVGSGIGTAVARRFGREGMALGWSSTTLPS